MKRRWSCCLSLRPPPYTLRLSSYRRRRRRRMGRLTLTKRTPFDRWGYEIVWLWTDTHSTRCMSRKKGRKWKRWSSSSLSPSSRSQNTHFSYHPSSLNATHVLESGLDGGWEPHCGSKIEIEIYTAHHRTNILPMCFSSSQSVLGRFFVFTIVYFIVRFV